MQQQSKEDDILSYFPFNEARLGQKQVIKEIYKAFQSGSKFIILEAPVGSGKSPIAMTFARKYSSSHIITPLKSLQDQYFADFKDDVVLMKGRNAYPCTIDWNKRAYLKTIRMVREGRVDPPKVGEESCANGPCRSSEKVFQHCLSNQGICPYNAAMETAEQHHSVIHNIHSFIFQTNFGGKFSKREILIIDEAHEIEGALRDFITKKFVVNKVYKSDERPAYKTVGEWCDYFLTPEFLPKISAADAAHKKRDPDFQTEQDKYISQVESFRMSTEYFGEKFTTKFTENVSFSGRPVSTSMEFIPHSLGNSAQNLLFQYGEKVLLMSGTIYNKSQYCKYLGINEKDAYFLRIPSSFPVKNRPIYCKPDLQVDTSFAKWDENFLEMMQKINKICNVFKDVKGLIHVPSYAAMEQISQYLPMERVMTHSKMDLVEKLNLFYESKEPLIFLSPVCQQGVDFKHDRARFQIITRVPYPSTADEFLAYKVKNDFPWYNYQALVTFGQQIGRINRAENDFGATFLLDSRFNDFIRRNSSKIPNWLKDGIIWK